MFRNRSVSAHQFSMTPRADIPRARFNIDFTHKTTFNAGYLIPVLCEEVLPGDSFSVSMTAFARLATPIFPLMDNLHLDSFFFFIPNRLVWTNWVKFMGEQDNPSDSISFTVPKLSLAASGAPVGSVFDYFGLPTVGQVTATKVIQVNALPLRAYNLVWNEWFRDENLQTSMTVNKGDSGDVVGNYGLQKRAKRPDYFTSALPWPQKGSSSVFLPIGTSAPVKAGVEQVTTSGAAVQWRRLDTGGYPANNFAAGFIGSGNISGTTTAVTGANATVAIFPSNLYADLSSASLASINTIRQAFQIQRLLERDARGGTRYTELVRSHFGVASPDARLQRSEYLGGGSTPIMLTPIAQSSATGLTGGSTPLGNLAAMGTTVARHGFTQSFVEHGYVLGLVNVRSDQTYQQGLRRHWSRSTRYDYYFPVFATLGEQAILTKEIYATGDATDDNVFGYQERWSEYRHAPSMITGLFRSTSAGTLDAWHLAQRFTGVPTLNSSFIEDSTPLSRVLAVGAGANGAQIIFDSLFRIKAARPLPLFSVPGMIDHF